MIKLSVTFLRASIYPGEEGTEYARVVIEVSKMHGRTICKALHTYLEANPIKMVGLESPRQLTINANYIILRDTDKDNVFVGHENVVWDNHTSAPVGTDLIFKVLN